MKIFTFSNTDNTLHVEYKTDYLTGQDNFTVHDVIGLDDAEIEFGLNFRRLPYTKAAFKAFATANNLTLKEIDTQANTTTALVTATDLSITTESVDGVTAGTAEVTVPTFPATVLLLSMTWIVDEENPPWKITRTSSSFPMPAGAWTSPAV